MFLLHKDIGTSECNEMSLLEFQFKKEIVIDAHLVYKNLSRMTYKIFL